MSLDSSVVFCAAFRAAIRRNYAQEHGILLEIDRRNRLPEYVDACATHDFEDSNMTADSAFRAAFNRAPDLTSENDLNLVNVGWSAAKRAGFHPYPYRAATPVLWSWVDDVDGADNVYPGFAHGSTWNGFDNVYMSESTWRAIARGTSLDSQSIEDIESLGPFIIDGAPCYSIGFGFCAVILSPRRLTRAEISLK